MRSGLLEVTINESELSRFLSDFNLPPIPVRLVPDAKRGEPDAWGTYFHGSHIELYLGVSELHASDPRMVAARLNETLLHELRHHWQAEQGGAAAFDDKPGAYWGTAHEVDAREFAEYANSKYRLVRVVKRAPSRSGFSRLSAAERTIRH